jgi:hypothetical protein
MLVVVLILIKEIDPTTTWHKQYTEATAIPQEDAPHLKLAKYLRGSCRLSLCLPLDFNVPDKPRLIPSNFSVLLIQLPAACGTTAIHVLLLSMSA